MGRVFLVRQMLRGRRSGQVTARMVDMLRQQTPERAGAGKRAGPLEALSSASGIVIRRVMQIGG